MSILSLKQSLTKDTWTAPTRREIGIGLQFLAYGLYLGFFLGFADSQPKDEVIWIQLIFTCLLLVGSWMVRSKAGEVIWIQMVVTGLILFGTWMMFRSIHGH